MRHQWLCKARLLRLLETRRLRRDGAELIRALLAETRGHGRHGWYAAAGVVKTERALGDDCLAELGLWDEAGSLGLQRLLWGHAKAGLLGLELSLVACGLRGEATCCRGVGKGRVGHCAVGESLLIAGLLLLLEAGGLRHHVARLLLLWEPSRLLL